MRNLLLVGLLSIWASAALYAQVPQAINYQGVARNAQGQPIVNQAVSLRLTIHQATANGAELYKELQTATTNQFGLFSVKIGTGQQFGANSFASINWGNADKYLQVEFDPNGGLQFTDLGTAQLISVPYALYAKTADTARYISNNNGYWQYSNILMPAFFDSIPTVNCVFPTDTFNRTIIMVGNNNYGLQGAPNIIQVNNGEFISLDSSGIASYVSGYGVQNYDPFYGYAQIQASNGYSKSWPGFMQSTSLSDWSLIQYNQNTGYASYLLINDQVNGGIIVSKGPNGNDNCFFSSPLGYADNGYLGVNNSSGQIKAGVLVNGSGQGVVFGDVKNFRVQHPLYADKEIWYASVEGPEAAMYERGTAQLVNGQAHIAFTADFALMCAANGITVQITPCSAASLGLAVVQTDTLGFTVKELANGTGTYNFNWEVKAVRKGYENYQVVRSKTETVANTASNAAKVPAKAPVMQKNNSLIYPTK